MLMSVMLISIMFVNMTSAAQIKDIKGTRVERQYSNHYSAQFNELWDRLAEVKFLYMILITI